MTCPLHVWNQLFRIDEASLPGDDAQLEVICCEADERVVSHIGIEYGNCVFNNEVLGQLRRKYGRDGKLSVEIRANDRASHIWVRDPGTRQWVEVGNQDLGNRDLTFAQAGLLERLRRQESDPGRLISRVEARRRMKELTERAQGQKTIRGMPRLLRLLGVVDLADRTTTTKQHLSRIGAVADSPKNKPRRAPPPDDCMTLPSPSPSPTPPPDGAQAPRPATRRGNLPIYEVIEGAPNDPR